MKIAILSFYSGHLERGVENWVNEMAKRLVKKHKVVVFQNGPAKANLNYETVSTRLKVNWKVKDSRGTAARIAFLDYWSLLIAISTIKILPMLFKRKFDIIIPTSGGWQPAFVRLITWLYGGKMVISGHSGPGWDDRNNLWCFPDVFVALSEPAAKWAKRANPFVKKVVCIPNGVDLELFNPQGKKAKVRLEGPIILAVGATEKGKRLSLAIDAVSKLGRGSLLILGGGYEERNIKSLGKKLLGNRFLMTGVPFEKIPEYYRAADIFTLPSWEHEAFGMVYLEAMASGLPAVATNDELRRGIIGSAGVLVDPTDIEAYAQALDKALKSEWRDRPRRQAEKFSWDKVVEKYERLFEGLIE